jgi:phage shock protein PspC (stress-responsive transcriptional regulator)
MLSFWIFLHLVGMAGFLATHGVSMYVMFQVRGMEGDRDKIFDLCLLSKRTIGPMYLSTALLVVAGVAAGIQAHRFGESWLWISIAVLLATMAMMSSVATPYMKKLREGCTVWHDGTYTLSEDELRAALAGPITLITAAVGTVGLLLILYLMVYKPGA